MDLDFSKKIDPKLIVAVAAAPAALTDLAIAFRAAQFVAHNSHHLVKGMAFFQDHEFIGELYERYTEAYDGIAERIIAFNGTLDVVSVTTKAAAAASSFNPDAKTSNEIFSALLAVEKSFCNMIKVIVPSCTDGTQNFLQGLADESEQAQYKISRRIM